MSSKRREGPLRAALITGSILVAVALVAVGVVAFDRRLSSDVPAERGVPTSTEALSAYESGDYAAAVEALSARVEHDGDDLEARKALADALAAQGKNREALAQLEVVVARDPADHETLYKMAVLERLIGDAATSIGHFEDAVAVEPKTSYLDELALTYMQVGRYVDAADCWEQTLESEQLDEVGRARAYAAMATALEGAREYDRARDALEQALALTPNDENLKARLQGMAG